MKARHQASGPSGSVGVLALPVVRPPEPPPAWILARLDGTTPAGGGPVTPGGVEEGYAEGMRRAESATAGDRRRLAAAIEALDGLRERMLREHESHIVDLALAIARELALCAAATDRELAVRVAGAALEEIGKSARVVLRVSPADRKSIEGWLGAAPGADARPAVVPIEDPALAAGEVIAETDFGRVDGRLETRLARIARALREGDAS